MGEGKIIHAWDKVRIDDYKEIESFISIAGEHPKFIGWVSVERVLAQKMPSVYDDCSSFENQKYLLRLVNENDLHDLHKVYSDKKAVPFFNGDNCHGDDFYYQTVERMKQAIDFWSFSYKNQYFVSWTIFDKSINQAIGTIELFYRDSEKDFFNNCGLLRLDLRSDYEKSSEIQNILSVIIPKTFDLFDCDKIATKCWQNATERKIALEKIGFSSTSHKLIGESAEYENYFVLSKNEN